VYFVNTKKAMTLQAHAETASPLHVELANRIARLIHDEAVEVGSRLNEKRLAELLGVSRTPVRAALGHLADQGFVERKQNRGVELVARPPLPTHDGEVVQSDALLAKIAADRRDGRLADQVSEQDLMRRYDLTRAAVKDALVRLADVGIVERKLGYRWKFLDHAYDAWGRAECYRFRLVLEPSAILEPVFALPAGWADDMAAQHEAFLNTRWTSASSVAFFEMNAAFHEGIARASGNRFFHEAMQRLNRLRRLSNYDWKHGGDRVAVSCREHLQMLDALQAGDVGHAALLMRQHLELASRLRSSTSTAANPN
jgi:DNA-binding GntR family transcriptional regulator